ncbi:putative ribonuclease H protein [Vitis vinifera]|uniref:Putative ribonuclease H protein n=1 Tax=Vitis vinifera TaxID=29760 RepID=A0A438DZA0_VITVI|nr:putative ribonuclease H protein [Vitis vinifera]
MAKRGEKGLICKLDIEKAYDSVNWHFLMRVLQKMGFGAKWREWMWSCISTAKFSVLVNGEPAGFFSSSKGLRQGDPISPYLFFMGMEVLSAFIRRAVEGRFISGCNIQRGTVSGLRINLAKSEIIPVGEVEEILEMAVELGCKDNGKKAGKDANRFFVGRRKYGKKSPPSQLGEGVCGKEKGGLGLRKLVPLNKALLGKWVWRFALAKDEMWKQVLMAKYGQEEFGWRTKKANGAFGVGVGKGARIRFWTDPWCGDVELSLRFPQLFVVAAQRNATVGDMWDQNSGELLQVLRSQRISLEEDLVFWKGGKNGKFGVKEVYGLLICPSVSLFPKNGIWVENVPSKLTFFAWEAAWGRVLTLDRLQKRGWQLLNRCYLCGSEEENVNHLLIHCTVVRVLWEIVLGVFGAQWVFPETVKEVVLSWKGSFVGKKRENLEIHSVIYFLDSLEGEE